MIKATYSIFNKKQFFIIILSINLTSIFLHNWANSFKNNDTQLGKRFIEDYQKRFYFSKEKDKGHVNIHNLTVNSQQVSFKEKKIKSDIIEVLLNKTLKPKDS